MDAMGAIESNDDTHATSPRHWVCRCSTPPILLATVEGSKVYLKIRDRYYHIEGVRGRVRAICPRCGKEHMLALGSDG